MPVSLEHAIAAIQSGDIATAQAHLMQLLRQDVRNEGAWLLLAQCVSDENQRRTCLQRVIALNPQNQLAHRLLAVLDYLPTQPAPEAEPFQPRPFALDQQTGSSVPHEHGKAAARSISDFHPQPFALEFSEAESAPSPVAAATPMTSLPPWVRSPH